MEEAVETTLSFETMEKKEVTLDRLMIRYGQDVQQLAYTYVKNRAVAEDLTQDIFIKCYRNLEKFNHDSSVKTWLFRIAINHCKDYLRGWHYRKVIISEKAMDVLDYKNKNVEEQVITKDSEEALVEAVFQLPVKYREVVFLYYFEEFSVKEISRAINVNHNTVKTRLKQARHLLKEKVKEV